MKIVAVLEDSAVVGGGFNQGINAVLQIQRLSQGRFDFEVLARRSSGANRLGLNVTPFELSLRDKLLLKLSQFPGWCVWQRRLRLRSAFEKQLLGRGCDLVYFVRQSELPGLLQQLNYVVTLFDLCHRDVPEFPEVRSFGDFQFRDRYFRTYLAAATLVLADSQALVSLAARRFGVDAQRMLVMPYAPSPALGDASPNDATAIVGRHGLAAGYFFYPAQFWAHKNHARILEALALLGRDGLRPSVVFCGGDKGNRIHVERLAARLGLDQQVRILGFVSDEDLRGLYQACVAVVMPTYFGPTNLPALEAWHVGKPLIYSESCAEQAGDAALCVDPDSAEELASAMRTVLDPVAAATLVAKGHERLRAIAAQRTIAEATLVRKLQQFEARRRCWA